MNVNKYVNHFTGTRSLVHLYLDEYDIFTSRRRRKMNIFLIFIRNQYFFDGSKETQVALLLPELKGKVTRGGWHWHAEELFMRIKHLKEKSVPKAHWKDFFSWLDPHTLLHHCIRMPRMWPECGREMIAFKAIQLHDDQWLSLRPCRNWLVSTCKQHLYIKIIGPRTHFLFWLLGDDSIYALLPLPAYGSDK